MPDRKSTRERAIPEYMRTPTPATERMEYMNIVRTIALISNVVAPQTSLVDGFAGRPANPNLFLLASSNLEDEIHFKCGRFVTSQNSKFWNVILNKCL